MKHYCVLLSLIALCLVSCENAMQKSLRENVEAGANGVDLKYKLISNEVVDTITVGDRLASLAEYGELATMGDNISRERYATMRDQEFKVLRSDTTYEQKVMTGDLKDASEWCTEIRLRTEFADSVLANWGTLKKDDWHFLSSIVWYTLREEQYYNSQSKDWLDAKIADFDSMREDYEEFISLSNSPIDSVLYYSIDHKYSIVSPILNKRIELRDSVVITPDMKILYRVNNADFGNILKSLYE